MAFFKTIQGLVEARKNQLLFILQIMTVVGVLFSIALMIHVGPLTLLSFMTVAQGLILVSFVFTLIILLTQKSNITREHFGPGQVIFRKGDPGEKLYMLVHGEVEVVDEEPGKEDRIIAKLESGECFGEMALISDNPRMATVRSRTGVSLICLDREGFRALFSNLIPLRRMFEKMVKERLEVGKGTKA